MKILLIGQHFAPEEVSGAILATELASDLVSRGHQVNFLTCTPNYPYGKPFKGYRNRFIFKETISGVHVTRIWSYISTKKTYWRRIINYGTFSMSTFYGGLIAGRPDIILSVSPPLPLGLSAWLLSRIWKVPWILRVEDLYPEAAVSMGVLKNNFVIRLLQVFERFLYENANHISVISEGFRENLIKKSIPETKISVFPVWADPELIRPMTKDNLFRKQYNLNGNFVILYSGNLGLTSSLEDVINAAEILVNKRQIIFLIIGEGAKKKQLEELVLNKQLTNVKFLPYQPRSIYPEVLASADVSLVTLNINSSNTSLPGKTYNIMASSRPILAIAPEESELVRLINENHCGVVVPPGKPDLLAEEIVWLLNLPDKLEEMGKQGRRILEEKFTRKRCVDEYERILFNTLSTSIIEKQAK